MIINKKKFSKLNFKVLGFITFCLNSNIIAQTQNEEIESFGI